jgi:hypothetical protein
MILKKLKRTSFKKPKAVMIGALVDYILAAADESGQEKTKYAGAKNLLGRTPDGWKAEMISLRKLPTKCTERRGRSGRKRAGTGKSTLTGRSGMPSARRAMLT